MSVLPYALLTVGSPARSTWQRPYPLEGLTGRG